MEKKLKILKGTFSDVLVFGFAQGRGDEYGYGFTGGYGMGFPKGYGDGYGGYGFAESAGSGFARLDFEHNGFKEEK